MMIPYVRLLVDGCRSDRWLDGIIFIQDRKSQFHDPIGAICLFKDRLPFYLSIYLYNVYSSTYRVFIKYCVFSTDFEYFGLRSFSVFPRRQCVYTYQAGRKPALLQNWQSSEKSQHFKEKTQYLMNTLYLIILAE